MTVLPHTLLRHLAWGCDAVSRAIGNTVAWFALGMVMVQLVVVLLRYVFGVGFIALQESMSYLHGFMFLFGAGYTLLVNGHVRVDIFYREAGPRTKAWVDLFGTLLLLWPMCALVIWSSWGQVAQSWDNLEGSSEASGIPAVFLLRTAIPIFAGLMIVQGVSVGVRSLLTLTGLADDDAHGAQARGAGS